MEITENDRLDLRQALAESLGSDHLANVAMEAMPPLDYDQLATKSDVDILSRELRAEMAALRGELAGRMGSIEASMAALESGLRGEMAGLEGSTTALESGLRGEMAGLVGKMTALESGLRGEVAGLQGSITALESGLRGEMAELRGELKGDLASNLRLTLAAQVTTMMMLGAWVTAVT